ncbi:hypothetical protein EJF18_10579 [Clavispora lusitaniae]|uniref:Uncharacterized protein n=1 Tax=Clavispora lusitaniae TaxID=36911 RepID=A0ACD0WE17_CLALS|nr:hypothetical protein EJF14_10579 [Clavispora lusitaniae]QFZ31214.1 hypothetical protein EJF16_10579 [Clavispora lusitaniae]QFZ36882.1 hypothetical protein EJF15_10579 [Clavispora lusitaniae]QFZ42566.1 hypothetical protein EJF18_10579 [Clavispora lusitaniae]QFZ48242.1 hypothetical protein EJF17_10579 [Clavispora lusitaniae]
MSGFVSSNLGAAASFYLALYVIYGLFMTAVVFKKGFKTVYTFLWVFGLIRFSGQLCGVVYAKLGPSHYQWLIAYLVLGAEGYLTLILAAFRFTCKAQIRQFGFSWVLTSGPFNCRLFGKPLSWKLIFQNLVLIPANVFIIIGGVMLAGMDSEQLENHYEEVNLSKGLRTTGQAVFVFVTFTVVAFNIHVYAKEKVRNCLTIAVMCASPFLLVRGIFGILAIHVTDMNYFDASNYTSGGSASHKLTIYEYVLGTTMEFIVACCLVSTLAFERDSRAIEYGTDEDKFKHIDEKNI